MRQHIANRRQVIRINADLLLFLADDLGCLRQLVIRDAGPAMVRAVQFDV